MEIQKIKDAVYKKNFEGLMEEEDFKEQFNLKQGLENKK